MRKGRSPDERKIESGDDKAVLDALKKVWSEELDGIMVMRG